MKQFLTFTVLVASLLAHSQTKDGVLAGRIKGTVTDQNGSPVPGETFGSQRYRLNGALPNLHDQVGLKSLGFSNALIAIFSSPQTAQSGCCSNTVRKLRRISGLSSTIRMDFT
jgi:hypothetical protein